MPEKQHWVVEEGTESRKNRNEVLAVAGLAAVLVGIVLVFADPSRIGIRELPATPSPTFSRKDPGTPLPTEAEAWGRIWSQAKGVAVLRPTWLPKSKDEFGIDPVVRTAPDGFFSYNFLYMSNVVRPGAPTEPQKYEPRLAYLSW